MTSKSAWGSGIGAWAAEAERAEEEEREEAARAAALAAKAPPPSFPSLKDSVTAAGKQKKKTKMSLHEFTKTSVNSGRLTPEEMMRLPTRPQERYGAGYRDSEGGGRRGYDRAPPPRVSEFDQMPSRADEVDNWGAMKKGPIRGGGVQPPPAFGQLGARSSFGSGFRSEVRSPRGGGGDSKEPERPVIVKVDKPNPFGAARPREEVLTEKGVDWKKLDEEIEVKKVGGISRPTSSHSSRPGSSHSVGSQQPQEGVVEELAVKPKAKVNPFGDAKPREVALAEKGLDYKKIDLELEHKRVDRPETDEEKNLKEEIENLKKDSLQKSDEEQANLHGEIVEKEKALELLIRELDDKVRFGQKIIDRPGSGSGRYTGPPSRHSPRSGPSDESRGNVEFMDRPRSRGTVDSLPRQNGDKRSFASGRDRGGFPGRRELDRSSPRSRW